MEARLYLFSGKQAKVFLFQGRFGDAKWPELKPEMRTWLGVLKSQLSVMFWAIVRLQLKFQTISQLSVDFAALRSRPAVKKCVISQLQDKILTKSQLSVKPHPDFQKCTTVTLFQNRKAQFWTRISFARR